MVAHHRPSVPITRRALLAGAGAFLAMPAAAAGSEPTLAQLGRAKGIEIGTAWGGRGSRKYRELIAAHCDLIVHEWQLKPRFLKPDPHGPWRFEEADAIARFARDHGKKLHGHTLYWHHEPIRWANSADLAEAKRLYGGFLRAVVGRYPDFTSWDVMNEIAEENTVLRDEPMLARFGYDFIDFCFRTVHEQAPRARLVLNDYNLECAARFCDDKRANMLEILKRLRAMGTPVHALGIQGHLSSRWRPLPAGTADFIARVADLGYEVYISELDVNDIDFSDSPAERDRQVAETYENFLSTVLEHEAVRRVVFWGLSDATHWITEWESEESRLLAARPALFDYNDDPKPALAAVRRALAAVPDRR